MSEAEKLWAQLSAANPDKASISKDDLEKMFKKMEPNARAKLMTDLVFLGLGDIKQTNLGANPDDIALIGFVPLKDISKETLQQALAAPVQDGNAPNVVSLKNSLKLIPDEIPVFAMVAKDQDIVMRMVVAETPRLDQDKNGITTHAEALEAVRGIQTFAQQIEGEVLNVKDKPKITPHLPPR